MPSCVKIENGSADVRRPMKAIHQEDVEVRLSCWYFLTVLFHMHNLLCKNFYKLHSYGRKGDNMKV